MAAELATHVPKMASDEGVIDAATKALGDALLDTKQAVGEVTLTVKRDEIVHVLKSLRDTPGLEYQQLMEMAGVDHLDRAAGKAESHPPQGPGPRPGEQVFGGGDHEALFVQGSLDLEELLLIDLPSNESGETRQLLLARHPIFVWAKHHSHSSAPFFQA